MQAAVYLRIMIVSIEPGAWCVMCGFPSAVTVAYVLEPAQEGVPNGLRLLTYCEACEGA